MRLLLSVSVVLLIIFSLTFFVFMNENQRWLFINGKSAEEYAIALLNQDEVKMPTHFIDYTVSASGSHVLFSSQDRLVIYGYFPEKKPVDINGIKWVLLKGNWYVAK